MGQEVRQVKSRGVVARVRRWFGRTKAGVPAVAAGAAAPSSQAVQPDPRIAVLVEEWKELRASLRQCTDRAMAHLRTFLVTAAAIGAAMLLQADGQSALAHAPHWVLPAIGMLLAALFACLTASDLARARSLLPRGLQVETAVELLLPGIGHVRTLGLLSQVPAGETQWLRTIVWLAGVIYGGTLVAFAAVLVATSVGATG
jgi:hypothetical protein